MSNHKNNDIIPISDLFGDNFMIPTYQRGYRWTRAQISAVTAFHTYSGSGQIGGADIGCLKVEDQHFEAYPRTNHQLQSRL